MTTIKLSGATNIGEEHFEFSLDTTSRKRISIIGPNGAGKSTLLRILGGHQRLNLGTLEINNVLVDSPNEKIFVPPHKRPVTLQHQDGGVFPHLSVLDNVAFPLRSSTCSKRSARKQVSSIIDKFNLGTICTRLPRSLSGGQIARVALARSVASNPTFLLLDEPSSSLDVESTSEIHNHLQDLETTLLIASHDPVETMKLTDFIIAVEAKRIIQQGGLQDLTSNPSTTWISKFLDLNLVSGEANGYNVKLYDGGNLNLSGRYFGPVQISFPSSAISIYDEEPSGSPRNRWEATVSSLDMDGDLVRVGLSGRFNSRATITDISFKELGIELGKRCWASVKATELKVLPSLETAKK